MSSIKRILGNRFDLWIPLQKKTHTAGGVVTEPFDVRSCHSVRASLNPKGGHSKVYTVGHGLEITNEGTVLHIIENGSVLTGVYGVTVEVVEHDGDRRRDMKCGVIEIVSCSDNMTYDDLATFYEGDVWLDMTVFEIAKGDKGDKGDPGIGIPTGGTTGQLLAKKTNTDYDTEWQDLSGYSTTEEMNAAIAAALTPYYQKPQAGIPVSDLALGMDNVPISGSDNFVKSGGVYSALQGKQDTLVSGTNIKTINNQSILGEGNITIQGGGSSVQSDWNQSDSTADDFIKNKPTIPVIPTNVSAFNNDAGYYVKPVSGIPKSDLASSVQTSLGKADTALQSFTETDPTVPAWAKAETKPTYTASEVGALPNIEMFYGDIRQNGLNYINHFGNALWAADKRFNLTVECFDANNNPISPQVLTTGNLFNLNYEGVAVMINSGGEKAIVTIKKGDDLDVSSSRFFTYGRGYIYVHFYSVNELPKTVTGRVYVQHQSQGWQPITFVQMENPNACYRAEIPSAFVYPSALEITFESKPENEARLVELEWFTARQNDGDVPLFSKARIETLYNDLTINAKLTVNNTVAANEFKLADSNNNYVLLGGGGTKALTEFFSGNYNDLTNKPTIPTVPTNVSAFTNDAGYITKTVNDLVNYYLKSDTYTKTEVQQLISAIQQFTYQVVSSLPTASADTMNKIYLVPSADPQTQNVKDEYITIDNGTEAQIRYTWEQIGSTEIDLSGYYTSQQTDAAITAALNAALANYTTTAALTQLLAGKQDVISDLAAIRSGAAAGATAYQKPQGGIPKTDLAQGVQDSLDKADTALQEDTLYEDANGHDYVEIAGMKWATKNIGANAVTDAGLYFQWGDIQGYTAEQVGTGEGKKAFTWADYKFSSDAQGTSMTKYNATDGKTVLELEDDAARANWGGSWRMPTTEEMQAFSAAVYAVWTDNYQGSGVAGLVCTDKTDNTKVVFFPAAGHCVNGIVNYVGSFGEYWGSSIVTDSVQDAYYLYFYNGYMDWWGDSIRCNGFPVRPILDTTQLKKDLDKKQNTLVSGTNIKTLNGESILGSGNINIDISGKEDVTNIVAPVNATDATLPITTLATEVGKYYRIDVPVETLAVTLPVMENVTTTKTVVLYLTGGTTPAVTITSTAPTGGTAPDVYYQDGFEIEAGGTYEINALFNGDIWIMTAVKIFNQEEKFVDLGLPSGTLWAKGNIVKDAQGNYSIGNETDYGSYFSWGNIDGHNEYSEDNYSFNDTNYNASPGYSLSANIASNDAEHDAAVANLGNGCHMPSKANFQELLNSNNCTWVYTTINGVNGYLFVSKNNGKTLFLPLSGYREDSAIKSRGEVGVYWSSSFFDVTCAYYLGLAINYTNPMDNSNRRKNGFTIRPVK